MLAVALLIQLWCCADLQHEQWQVASDRIPEAFDGFRVTLLTDIHGAAFGKDSRRLLEAVEQAKPDMIAISGDLVDEFSDLSVLEPMLTGLVAIAPTCYVTGNHEWSRDDTEQLLLRIETCGVSVLRGDWFTLEKDGQSIVVAGAEDPNGYADQLQPDALVAQIREAVPNDPYILMLYHRNNSLELWAELEVDLVLAGHGHGGVIRLPFVGGVLGVERQLFPDDCEGLYAKGRTALAVSRGVAGVRVWNRPHIPTIVLKHVNNS